MYIYIYGYVYTPIMYDVTMIHRVGTYTEYV